MQAFDFFVIAHYFGGEIHCGKALNGCLNLFNINCQSRLLTFDQIVKVISFLRPHTIKFREYVTQADHEAENQVLILHALLVHLITHLISLLFLNFLHLHLLFKLMLNLFLALKHFEVAFDSLKNKIAQISSLFGFRLKINNILVVVIL